MKILHIIPNFETGGAEKVVLNYLKSSKNIDEIELLVVSLYKNSNSIYNQDIKNQKLNVKYLNKNPGFDISIVFQLREIIDEFNPDIIHTHLYTLKYLLLTGKIINRKCFHTIHSYPKFDASGIDYFLNKLCFKIGIIKPVALNESMAVLVQRDYKVKNVGVIYNGLFFEEYRNENKNIRNELNLPKNAFVVGHIGSFKEAKNHKFIINVFKKLHEINDNSYLLLIGSGPLEIDIVKMVKELGISDCTRLLGNRNDISELLHTIDVFLFPSLYEGLGISLIEAQLCEVYSIASNFVPKEAIVSRNLSILTLDSEAEWIRTILTGKSNVEEVEDISKYNINSVMQNLLQLYLNKYD